MTVFANCDKFSGEAGYWSVQWGKDKIEYFDCPQKAAEFDTLHNCGFTPWGGVYFHKEKDGKSILPSDIRGD